MGVKPAPLKGKGTFLEKTFAKKIQDAIDRGDPIYTTGSIGEKTYTKSEVAAAVAWLKAALWKSAGGKPRQTGKTILQILSVNMVKKVEELIDAAFPDVIDGNKQEV